MDEWVGGWVALQTFLRMESRIDEGESFELILIHGLEQLIIGGRQFRFLHREVWIEVVYCVVRFLQINKEMNEQMNEWMNMQIKNKNMLSTDRLRIHPIGKVSRHERGETYTMRILLKYSKSLISTSLVLMQG